MNDSTISLRYLFNKGSILLVLKLLSAFIAFCFHAYIARRLSLEEFGLFNLAMSCIVFTVAIAKQGLEPAIVKVFSSIGLGKITFLYQHVIFYTVVNLLVVCGIFWVIADMVFVSLLATPQLIDMVPLLIVLTAFQTWLGVNSSVLKSQQYPVLSLFFTGITTYCVALVICFYLKPISAFDVLTVLAYSTLAAVFLSFVLVKIKLNIGLSIVKKSTFTEPDFVSVISVSKILFVSVLSALITQQLGVLVLAKYASLADVGLYSVALKISLLLSYPLMVVNMITAPKYAKLYALGKIKEVKSLSKLTTKALVVIATLMIIFVYVLADRLVLIFGDSYQASAQFLFILAIGQWFNLATGSVVSILIMTGHERLHRKNMIFIALFTCVSLFVFVPIYGVIAAAWVNTLAMTTLNLISLYFVNRHIYQVIK